MTPAAGRQQAVQISQSVSLSSITLSLANDQCPGLTVYDCLG